MEPKVEYGRFGAGKEGKDAARVMQFEPKSEREYEAMKRMYAGKDAREEKEEGSYGGGYGEKLKPLDDYERRERRYQGWDY